MTKTEFNILEFFMLHRGVVYDRDSIIRAVWADNTNIGRHNVDVTVRRIRVKIEPDQRNPQYILTTKGMGYSSRTRRADLFPAIGLSTTRAVCGTIFRTA